MGQKSKRVDRRWIVLLLASLAVAVGAIGLLYFPLPWRHHDPGVPASEVLEVLKAVTAPTLNRPDTAVVRQQPSVPSEARLAEQLSINGYTIKTWDTSVGSVWEHGRAMVEVIGPDGSVSTIDWVSRLDSVSGQDITGDGNPDLVVERYSGGASCCVSYVVLSLGDELASISLPLDSSTQAAFRDLDADGILEVIGTDDSFRCVFCCCANSPLPTGVLRYDRERGYIPASPDFPEIYDAVIPEYQAKAEGRWNGPFEEQDPTGRCYVLPLVLAYLYSGRASEAWQSLEQHSMSVADARELRGEIERIVSGSRLFVARENWRDLLATRKRTFSVSADLDKDGAREAIVGVAAKSAEGLPEFESPGDVYVFASTPDGVGSAQATPPSFTCRSSLSADLLPYFVQASLIGTGDLDGDGLTEVVLVWLGEQWWPEAYRPLAILQYDPSTDAYEMVTDVRRSVGEIGDYALADLDSDGRAEILEIDPIYGTVIDPTYGAEVYECHFCPHRYQVGVFEFTGTSYVADSRVNGGQPFQTDGKYEPYLGEGPVTTFLPELIDLARGFAQSSSVTAFGTPDP
jgi:hypothetical protein